MREFIMEIEYYSKKKEERTIETTDNLTALTIVLNSLSLYEKDNVKGIKVVYAAPNKK